MGRQGDTLVRALSLSPCLPLSLSICLLAVTSVRAAEHWIDTRQSGPFVCQATFRLQEYESLLAELQQLQPELVRVLGIAPAAEPVYIYLFSDADAHRRYLAEHFPDVPYRPALFVKEGGLAGVYAYRHPGLDVDLRHECTHALLNASLPAVPLWLDEGLAKYFEVPADERAFAHPYFACLRWDLRLGMVRDVRDLEQRHELAEMGSAEYRYSWAWVHFMLHGPAAAHATLVHYLADIRRGQATDRFADRLERAVPDANSQLVRHFCRWHE